MKINDLSKLTGINSETIRMYRNMGLLSPIQQENGYYDYQFDDFVKLHFVKKMREYQVPLSTISTSMTLETYLGAIVDTKSEIEKQIVQLKDQLEYINMEIEHLENVKNNDNSQVQVIQSLDSKIDIYDFFDEKNANKQYKYFKGTSPTLLIKKEYLNDEIKEEKVPIKIGIGMYKYALDKVNMPFPNNANVIPNGLFVTQVIAITDFKEVNISQLKPMIEYAKNNNLKYISDTTAFLVGFSKKEDKTVYIFRIRACIQENNLKSNTKHF